MIKRGDVMFRHGEYHHTLVVSDPKNFEDVALLRPSTASQQIEVIHAASVDSGVYRETIEIDKSEASGNSFTFYRPVAPALANGVNFAVLWAHHRASNFKVTKQQAKGPVTLYSFNQLTSSGADKSRYSGVQDSLHSKTCPPFEFDALYRAFKWASRQRTGFSKERGTTCCAFITACFQAAVIDHFAVDYPRIAAGLELLKQLRGEKRPKEERDRAFEVRGSKQKKIAHTALRDFANPGGFSKRFGVDDYCNFVTKEVFGKELTVADMFPPALRVDAKFNYSSNFEKMIATPNSGFTRVL